MFDPQDFQSLTSETVKNQVILEAVDPPGANVFQASRAETPQPPFPRLLNQPLNRFVNCLQKSARGIRVAQVNILKVAERIHFGVMPDEEGDVVQSEEDRRREGVASAAKWPGTYFLMGLRSEWRSASSSSSFDPSCSTSS